jgi:hypothetical protein
MFVGAAALLAYVGFLSVRFFFTDADIPVIVRLGVGAVTLGVGLAAVFAVVDRYRNRSGEDRYGDVEP